MKERYFITITGLNHYYGQKPFEINRIFKIVKEQDNQFDDEAIYAFLPYIEKIGYVANCANTVYKGTSSAGRIYDKFEDYAFARVMFITHSSVIAVVLDKDEVEDQTQITAEAEQNKSEEKGGIPLGFAG